MTLNCAFIPPDRSPVFPSCDLLQSHRHVPLDELHGTTDETAAEITTNGTKRRKANTPSSMTMGDVFSSAALKMGAGQ